MALQGPVCWPNIAKSGRLCQHSDVAMLNYVRFLADIDRNLAHARFASVANARQSDIRHASVDHRRSWYALTVALKRIQRITLAAQNTARCVKHPVIDRSLARARTASVASANKAGTRLENAEKETFAPLRMMPMRKVSMILPIRMPTTAR